MTEQKLVSVFIPCRNEVKSIARCVESVFNSDYANVECIVVDGMSEDGTRELLIELQKKYPRLRMVDNPMKLTPYAFNLGVLNSQGEYVQISGSRNVLDANYISSMVKVLESHPEIGCVGGNYHHAYENDESRYISYAMESKFGVGASNYRTMKESCYVDTVGVPMYRRSIFNEVGLFDEQLTRNQDDDFNYRVIQKGYKIYYLADVKSLYYVRGSLKKAFRQFSQYGYFKVFVNRKHKTVTTLRQLVPAGFVAFLVIGFVISLFKPVFASLITSVLLIYFIGGFISAGWFTKNWQERLKIQRAMLALHTGYGLGYLRGLLDFIVLDKPEPHSSFQQQTT